MRNLPIITKPDKGSRKPGADWLLAEQSAEHDLQIIRADTDDLRKKSYKLRYSVYCVENEFEPIANNPGGMESDRYDIQSRHCLMQVRPSGRVIGTVRLIMPSRNGSALDLPTPQICSPEILAANAHRIPLDRAGELSRFAITKGFRRMTATKGMVLQGIPEKNGPIIKRPIPHVSLGLMQAIVAMANEGEVTHLFAMMEPSLLRMLKFLGIYFENLGPLVDHHGWRQPCFCDLDNLLATTYAMRPDIWRILTDDGRHWRHPAKPVLSRATTG